MRTKVINDINTPMEVIQTDLSDHYAVFSLTLNFSSFNSKGKVIYRRDKTYI